MDHVPSNALRVFYISRYRVKEVPALSYQVLQMHEQRGRHDDHLNILHDKVLLAWEVKDFLQLDDVGMVYCCQDGDFALYHVLFPLAFRLQPRECITP